MATSTDSNDSKLSSLSDPDEPKPTSSITLRLTSGLMDTYDYINQSYYQSRQQPIPYIIPRQTLDADSNYIPLQGELLNGRYRLVRALGKGSFGRVYECTDVLLNVNVACKIIKNKRAFIKQAETEVSILQSFAAYANDMHLVQLQDTFFHCGHPCLVFELLATNLYELLRNTKFSGITLPLLAKISYQVVLALNALTNLPDGRQILHCDLKPENIMLINASHSRIKLIDFGSACFDDNTPFTYIQSRYYRSPEILLGLPYDSRIDLFSLGCLMAEMFTGKPLFDGQSELEQLRKHEQILGPVKQEFIESSQKARKFYLRDFQNQQWVLSPPGESPLEPTTLRAILGVKGKDMPQFEDFLDLVTGLLQIDPEIRITPEDALHHPYFLNENSRSLSTLNQSVKQTTTPAAVVRGKVCEESVPSIFTSPVLPQSPPVSSCTTEVKCTSSRKRKPSAFLVPIVTKRTKKSNYNEAGVDQSSNKTISKKLINQSIDQSVKRSRSQRLTRSSNQPSHASLHFDAIAQRTRSRQGPIESWPSPTIEVS